MPALRERREDIPLLASYFAMRFSQKSGRLVKGISLKPENAFPSTIGRETFANSRTRSNAPLCSNNRTDSA
jgi:transcriptional regulator with AAA-type ATPase domain